ncbi:MAG: T9SS type A sorting domain-containing protein [Candidatus Marinimicrobia bacterium]|nr:T9SS type A sorting domain-containing protein [Candidatus Neomarinimicrobiota bacterium]MBL7023647.1 T9SS type A sorting domain-containing protein [Candidatus Neomarinimicrobiota bacterium]MBL7109799.1 T9SS type A sorting domain-containing protein [Candidatus Neomarinimicrobiota bacterium]
MKLFKPTNYFLFYVITLISLSTASDWNTLTSMLTPTGITIQENDIYASTVGGLLKFDRVTNEFSFIKHYEGLEHLDISTMAKDSYNQFWLGGNSPNGTIQIYHTSNGLVEHIQHLDIDEIIKFSIRDSLAFAIYRNATTFGIIKLLIDDEIPVYIDYYNNFPISFQEIVDIDHNSDSVFVTTDGGILTGSLSDNLKIPSSWEVSFANDNPKQVVVGVDNFIITSNEIMDFSGSNIYNLGFNGNPIDAQIINNQICLLTTHQYYEFDLSGNVLTSFAVPVSSQFTCFDKKDETIVLGINNHGFLLFDSQTTDYEYYVPNTLASNIYTAISTTENNELIGVGESGSFIQQNSEQFVNFIPSTIAESYPINIESEFNYFIGYEVDFVVGSKDAWSIIQNNSSNLVFSNSGIRPSNPANRGGVIEINPETAECTVYDTTNGVLDGLNGIYNSSWTNSYLVVHQIKEDNYTNTWVVNPYSETYNHIAAVQLANSDDWIHITAPDNTSYYPHEITFDNRNRVWFGLGNLQTMGESSFDFSKGAIKVLDYNNLEDETDDEWFIGNDIDLSDLPDGNNTTVWSLEFDNSDQLWVLTDEGVQGYFVYNYNGDIQLDAIRKAYDTDGNEVNLMFLSYASFDKGDKIRIDAQDNKWIISKSGAWIIQQNLSFWHPEDNVNSEEGITEGNSGLLSNYIYDIAFDNVNGIAYLATNKGVSTLDIPFSINPTIQTKLSISPNPFIIKQDSYFEISNFYAGSTVKIMTLSGKVVFEKQLPSNQNRLNWDGSMKNGNYLGSGVYLVTVHHTEKGNAVTKLAIIRQ